MGLNLLEFYHLSPNELYEALIQKTKEFEDKRKFDLETMRLQTFYIVNSQVGGLNDPKDLMKFQWEDEEYDESKVIVPNWTELDKKFIGGK